MASTLKVGDAPAKNHISHPSTSDQVMSNEFVSDEIDSASEKQEVKVVSTESEVISVINTECMEEGYFTQIPSSAGNEGSRAEFNEHLLESSEDKVSETVQELRLDGEDVLGKENPKTCHYQPAREEIKVEPNDCRTASCNEETISKTEEHGKMEMISQKQTRPRESRDQCCQVNCLSDKGSNDEVKILKEKLAISKKDTDTMQKLLEDVRKDYEELQKSFEKRESDEKNKALADGLMKEKDETEKERVEFKRGKKLKRGNKASTSDEKSETGLSEKKKADVTGIENESLTTSELFYASEIACPCFVQSIRKIVTDVREDFKDTISVLKQSSAEHCVTIGNELTKLKDEYSHALEKKNSEIFVFQEVLKNLQSRMADAEREAITYRALISSSLEDQQKLYDDIRLLKDQLLRTRQENETNQSELEKIKHGFKRYCTAEEYEELQRSNFQFRAGDYRVNVDGGQVSEIDDRVSEVRNKAAKFHPVLKKAKKEIAQLKEEKQDAENRLREKISEGKELESYLNKQLSAALDEMRRKERAVNELNEELIALKNENAKLKVNADGLEKEKENMLKKHGQELEAIKNKLKKSNESLQFHKVKNEQMREDYEALNGSYQGLKQILEEEKTKTFVRMSKGDAHLFDDEDSVGQLLKDEPHLQKQLKIEKEKHKSCLREIEDLKKELNQWKKMVRDDMDTGMGFLRIENEELKDEIDENQIVIKQLAAKKKLHIRIIKKLREENALLKSSCDTATDEYDDISFDSCEAIESEEPGSGRTSTEEHLVTFDKNGKKQKPECSENDEDSLFNEIKNGVHFSYDNIDFLNDDSSLEVLEYDTSISEKE